MFGKNLRYLRNKHKMEQIEVARHLGKKSTSSISDWEAGRYTPKLKTLNELANLFNVTIDDLMEVDLENLKRIDNIPFSVIPIVSKISAGEPLFTEENIEEYSVAPSTSIKPGKDYFYLRVSGDSMDRHFSDGDLLLVEKDSPVENGQIGVVFLNGYDATVKRIKYADDKIYLYPESNNPDHFPQIYTEEDGIQIVGRVVSSQTFY